MGEDNNNENEEQEEVVEVVPESRFATPQQEEFVLAPEEAEPKGTRDEVSELTEVSEEDVMGRRSDNVEQGLDEEDDMEDLFEVGDLFDDEPEEPKLKPKLRYRRVIRRYPPPPTTISGVRE